MGKLPSQFVMDLKFQRRKQGEHGFIPTQRWVIEGLKGKIQCGLIVVAIPHIHFLFGDLLILYVVGTASMEPAPVLLGCDSLVECYISQLLFRAGQAVPLAAAKKIVRYGNK